MVEIMRNNTFIPGLIIVFLGVIFTGGGLVMIISKRRKDTRCTAIAAGQVIERRVDHSKEGGPDALVIQYVVDDVTYTQETNGEGVRRKYKIGDEMGVEYDPAKPKYSRAAIDRKSDSLFETMFFVVGLHLIVIGILVWFLPLAM